MSDNQDQQQQAPQQDRVKQLTSVDEVKQATSNSRPSVFLINDPSGIGLGAIILGVYRTVASQVQAVDFYYVDASTHSDIAQEYEATSYPTVLVYKEDKLVQAVKGFADVSSLSSLIGNIGGGGGGQQQQHQQQQ